MRYLTACAIVKNEAPYMREWIEFHKIVGFEKFYIYDNNSEDNLLEVLDPYIKDGTVRYLCWDKPNSQCEAYNDYLKRFRFYSEWTAFFDPDEFIFAKDVDDLRLFLKDYEQYAGLGVNWVCFGSSGYVDKPDGLVIENFTKRSEIDVYDNHHIKTFINNKRSNLGIYNPHSFRFRDDEYTVDENFSVIKRNVENHMGALTDTVSVDKIRINHYLVKSRKEYELRSKRGCGSTNKNKYNDSYFSIHNINDIEDKEIHRFLPRLKGVVYAQGKLSIDMHDSKE